MDPVVYLGKCPPHPRVKALRKYDAPCWLRIPLSPSEMEEKKEFYNFVDFNLKIAEEQWRTEASISANRSLKKLQNAVYVARNSTPNSFEWRRAMSVEVNNFWQNKVPST